MYIPGYMSDKNEWNWPYSLWTKELKQHNFGHPKCQLFLTGQFDFVMGKSTISQRWQVIGMKAAGSTISHIAQTMQMSQITVYSILRRHRWNPADVKDRPRSGRRYATTGREDRALMRLARQQRYATFVIIGLQMLEFQPEQWGTDSCSMGTYLAVQPENQGSLPHITDITYFITLPILMVELNV